ncbi:MAG: ABC transporter ATP-binding protein [Deltaproteobacteria bacterium]|nr:ABC transporter ATP-binding protein [Deltaproteobacteria bacterium]
MAVLEVTGLRKVFGSGSEMIVALDHIDLTVEAGELVALLGPSGSGKSTLLLCISMIVGPTSGQIRVNARDIFRDGATRVNVRRYRRENIGFIFQSHNLIPFLNARDNVAVAMELNGVRGREARRRAVQLLDYLELGHRALATPDELSGGEQQRVAIARALANEPRILFADEPTASLDTERGFKVMGLLKKIAKERGSAVIAVTHDERMISGFDTVKRMRDGRFVTSASAPTDAHGEMLQRPEARP